MPQIQLFVSTVKVGNSVKVNAVNDSVSIDRTITKLVAPAKENLAKWLLSQIDTAAIETGSYEGVFDISYHTEESANEEDALVEEKVLDSVSVSPLPAVLRRDLDGVLVAIDSIGTVSDVKIALKQLARAVSFVYLRGG